MAEEHAEPARKPGTTDPGTTAPGTVPPPLPTRPDRVPWPAVGVFVVLAFGLGWLVCLPMWLSGGLANPLAGVLLILLMFTPGLAAIIVIRFVQKPQPRPMLAYLGMWPIRPVGRTIWLAVIGLFGSVLVSVASVFVAAAVGVIRLDLVGFSGFAAIIQRQLEATGSTSGLPLPIGILVLTQLAAIPFGALINSIFAFGEELGWRGWLLPSLRPLGTWPALILSGAIWGLWHSPVILLGYNFGQPNLLGVLYMVLGCTAYGVLIGWLRLRSASVWPSAIAHGAFNASAGIGVMLMAVGSPGSPVDFLPLGWAGWIVCAAIAVVLVLAGQFRRQPALGQR